MKGRFVDQFSTLIPDSNHYWIDILVLLASHVVACITLLGGRE